MGLTSRFAVLFVTSGIGLYLASLYVAGFAVPLELQGLALAAAALSLINLFVRPIIRLVLSPIIFITFGIASILVNAATLWLLDYLLTTVTISGLGPLFWGTIVVSAINVAVGLVTKVI